MLFRSISLGLDDSKINGAAFVEGPLYCGSPTRFPNVYAGAMFAPLSNEDSPTPVVPGSLCSGVNNPYTIAVAGPSALLGAVDTNDNINAGKNVIAQGDVISNCGGHILAAKKNFDIPHPTKDGWRLRYGVLEGPEHGVYHRGRITTKVIELPDYWTDLVDISTTTVHLTPIGTSNAHFVVKIENNQIFIDSDSGSIDAFFIVHAERKDTEKVLLEYKPNK